MKTFAKNYQRQIRQFRAASKQMNRLVTQGQFAELNEVRQNKLVKRLQRLFYKVKKTIMPQQVRKALAGSAFLMSLLTVNPLASQAQTFDVPPVSNPFNINLNADAYIPIFADIDDDGDQDMMIAAYTDPAGFEVQFLENVGTATQADFSGASVVNPFGLEMPATADEGLTLLDLADLDNDGDLDVLVSGVYTPFTYYENVGTSTEPSFGVGIENAFSLPSLGSYGSTSAKLVDIDNDGDQDLIASEYYGTGLFYENIGTPEAANFAAPTNNPFNLLSGGMDENTYFILNSFTDMDGDGDFDVLHYAFGDADYGGIQGFFYQENIGTPEIPNFSAAEINPFNITINDAYLVFPTTVDIDDDGDTDLIFGVYSNNEVWDIRYYENGAGQSIPNTPPTSSDTKIVAQQDMPYHFVVSDFVFVDVDSLDAFNGIQITELPSEGVLVIAGDTVQTGQIVDIATIEQGGLLYIPPTGAVGDGYDSFTFAVYDGEDFSLASYSASIDIGVFNSTNDLLQIASLKLSPNPVTNQLTLSGTLTESYEEIQVTLLDLTGRVWQTQQIGVNGGQFTNTFDVSHLPTATYLLQVTTTDKTATLKFMKQ
ncbi:MAG: T9SS type A sorting domain-containing protein [Chitinophagales bacterium]